MGRTLQLYVYNNEYDVVRLVNITPARGWGGEGALGCVLGFGALHRVPAPLTEPSQAPGETLFETARFSKEENRPSSTVPSNAGFEPTMMPTSTANGELFTPANMQFTSVAPSGPPPTGGPPRAGRKARAHHTTAAPAAAMDDYFKEGEQKSMEADNAPTPKPNSSLPPPPKAGHAPPASEPATAPEAEAEATEESAQPEP